MTRRILSHVGFWLLYVLLFVVVKMYFAPPTDMAYPPVQRFLRFFLLELAFLPWKAIPFYVLFYVLVPKYLHRGEYVKIGLFFVLVLLLCLTGMRSMVAPANELLYGDMEPFDVYSVKRFLYSLTELLPALGLASTAKLLKGRIAALQKVQALQAEKRASELNFLKAQTNPHFLFNTLNNLYGLARKNDENTAPSIMKLAEIMRYILYECQTEAIPIRKEVELLEAYIELERLRYDDRLTVHFTQAIDDHDQAVAPLILLPFVENAFKHGASESRFDFAISIDLKVVADKLSFRVENTVDHDSEKLVEGIGLSNARRQLELIYGNQFTLEIATGPPAFVVELEIGKN